MVQIKNLQNLKRINQAKLRKIIGRIVHYLGLKRASFSLVFCDNQFIKRLNRKYFKKSSPTDVISFPLKDKFNSQFLGEVVISVEEALRNAQLYRTSFNYEITLYIIHGLLHLLGYKDYPEREKKKMENKEKELLKRVEII